MQNGELFLFMIRGDVNILVYYKDYDTEYDFKCHKVFNVTMVTFRMTLLMDTLRNTAMKDWNLDEKSLGKWQ